MAQPLPSKLSYTDLQNYITSQLQSAVNLDAGVDAASDGGAQDRGGPRRRWTVRATSRPSTRSTSRRRSTSPTRDWGCPSAKRDGLGYHDDVVIDGRNTPYSVSLECTSQTLPQIEETAAHEAVEAATNPYPSATSDLGYVHFDSDHLAWDLFTGYNDELADACENWQTSYYQETGSFAYWVQRSWSNRAALLGHDPCVPAPSGPYHGMTLVPSEESTVTVNLAVIGAGKATSKGFPVTVGQPLTFHVGFFSDAPTSAWTIGYSFPRRSSYSTPTFSPSATAPAR